MAETGRQLSLKAVAVLEMIAAGSSYEQILAAYPNLTYMDIFHAASEAMDNMIVQESKPSYQVVEIRKSYPRACEKWTGEEEEKLQRLIDSGLTVAQIASRLQRQRSAIRSRITRLNLVDRLSSHEQSELLRISKLDPAMPDPSDDNTFT